MILEIDQSETSALDLNTGWKEPDMTTIMANAYLCYFFLSLYVIDRNIPKQIYGLFHFRWSHLVKKIV